MSGRDRRALFAGGIVILFAWLGLRTVPQSFADLRRREADVMQRAELLMRAQQRVANLSMLSDTVEGLTIIAEALPRLLLRGGDASTAIVDLIIRDTYDMTHKLLPVAWTCKPTKGKGVIWYFEPSPPEPR